jgi:hypothetical protein
MITPAMSPATTAPQMPHVMMFAAASTAAATTISAELPHVPRRSAFKSVIMLALSSLQRTANMPATESTMPMPERIIGAITALTPQKVPATTGRQAPSAAVERIAPQYDS